MVDEDSNPAAPMTDAITIRDLPHGILREILLQLDDAESVGVAAHSCREFYSTFITIPRLVLEQYIPPSVLPYAYAVLKCEQEGLATASDEAKTHLLDIVYNGTTEFRAFFPDSELNWDTASDASRFFEIVQRLSHRAANGAARAIRYEIPTVCRPGRVQLEDFVRSFEPDEFVLSEAETLRLHLVFYRNELHFRLFSTTHGAQLSHDMEEDFFRRLQPWETEQCMIVEDWMSRTIRKGESDRPLSILFIRS
ncbi:hypothetical protein IMZ48_25495 [Candidatus Bathyarchaeota archaeon]|nr:hypothetical protein [Candidatus Bathyarchaeota archaeon]